MAKEFGHITGNGTAVSSIGTLVDLSITDSAEVAYSTDATGAPDGDNGGVMQPKTMSATLELSGTKPAAKTTLTLADSLGSTTFILTKVGEEHKQGVVRTCSIEGTQEI